VFLALRMAVGAAPQAVEVAAAALQAGPEADAFRTLVAGGATRIDAASAGGALPWDATGRREEGPVGIDRFGPAIRALFTPARAGEDEGEGEDEAKGAERHARRIEAKRPRRKHRGRSFRLSNREFRRPRRSPRGRAAGSAWSAAPPGGRARGRGPSACRWTRASPARRRPAVPRGCPNRAGRSAC